MSVFGWNFRGLYFAPKMNYSSLARLQQRAPLLSDFFYRGTVHKFLVTTGDHNFRAVSKTNWSTSGFKLGTVVRLGGCFQPNKRFFDRLVVGSMLAMNIFDFVCHCFSNQRMTFFETFPLMDIPSSSMTH